jgi:hypothetical protein
MWPWQRRARNEGYWEGGKWPDRRTLRPDGTRLELAHNLRRVHWYMRDWCFIYQRLRHLERFVQGFGYSSVEGYASGYDSFLASVYGFKGTHYGSAKGVTFHALKFGLVPHTQNSMYPAKVMRLPPRPYGTMPAYVQADRFGDFAQLPKTYPLLIVYDNLAYPMELVEADLQQFAEIYPRTHASSLSCVTACVSSIRTVLILTTLNIICSVPGAEGSR